MAPGAALSQHWVEMEGKYGHFDPRVGHPLAPSPRGPRLDGAPGVHPGNLLRSIPPIGFLPPRLPHSLTFASREHLPNKPLAPNPHLNSACWRTQLKTSEMMGASPGGEEGCEGGFEKQGV